MKATRSFIRSFTHTFTKSSKIEEASDKPNLDDEPERPRFLRYEGVAGEWERELHPEWPESRFQIPEEVPFGTVYYVRKGKQLCSSRQTALIELSPEGHVIKSPKPNPYDPKAAEKNIKNMQHEAGIYRRIGPDCPYIPKVIAWDQETSCLNIEYLRNGPLSLYIKGPESHEWKENMCNEDVEVHDIDRSLRRRWTLQVTRGLAALHKAGIIHSDLTPRNVLLGSDMNVRIADFADCCIEGVSTSYSICAGERCVAPGWDFDRTPSRSDDLFLLAGLLYFIMTGEEPYEHVFRGLDVAILYESGLFPDVNVEGTEPGCGSVIEGCWRSSLESADEVLEKLLVAFGTDDDPLVKTG